MTRTIRLSTAGTLPSPARRIAATLLLGASAALARAAKQIEVAQATSAKRTIEFAAAEIAGQPGGALYEDGRLVGWLPGITRL